MFPTLQGTGLITKLAPHKFVYIELKTAKPVQRSSELKLDVQSLQIPG
jgi:hypothetical protein